MNKNTDHETAESEATAAAKRPTTESDSYPPKASRKWLKRLAIALLILFVAGFAGVMWLFVDSTKAVNQYVDDVNKQYQQATGNKTDVGEPAAIRSVPLGDVINAKYKQMKQLDGDYKKLLTSLTNYNLVKDAHNKIVAQFNDGINGKKVLNGDILTTVNHLLSLMQDNYPTQKTLIDGLTALSQKISSSTNFTDISSEVNTVLKNDEAWLNQERETIDNNRAAFEKKMNAI